MRSSKRVKKFFSSTAFFGMAANLFGLALYGAAKGPDVHQGFVHIFGAFLLFLSYLFAELAWGSVLGKVLNRAPYLWEDFFYGTAFLALLIAIFGFFPILGKHSFPGWEIFFFVGYLFSYKFCEDRKWSSTLPNKLSWIDMMAFLVLLLGVLGSFTAHGFWDSLWYHLPASRIWFLGSHIFYPSYFPIVFKSGLWDYHFLFGQILLSSGGEGGLISSQLFGQWANYTCLIFSYILLRQNYRLFGLSLFSISAALFGSELFMMAEFAKNDWGAIFWGLCFFIFILRKEDSFLIGLSSAICFTAKFTSAFFLLPMLLYFFIEEKNNHEKWRNIFFFTLLFSLPILIRNFYFTHNPFFPTFPTLFPSILGPSWNSISDYEGFTWGIKKLISKSYFLATDNWIFLGLITLPYTKKYFGKLELHLIFLTILSTLLFLFFSGPKAEWRLLGVSLLFLVAYGARAIELSIQHMSAKFELYLVGIFACLLLIYPIDWRAPLRLIAGPELVQQVRSWVSGSAMAWTRLNLSEEVGLATLNEQRIYYLFPHRPQRVFDIAPLDQALANAKDSTEAMDAIQRYGIRYLVLSAEFLDSYYNRKVCDWFYLISERNPQAILFKSEYSRVLDLNLVTNH